MIALGADHGGYRLKEAIKKSLDAEKIAYRDFGTFSEESVDYPPIAAEVARFVADGHAEKGILCCGTGIGMSIAANKITGIRAAVCTNAFCAEVTRRHNDANILCLGGRVISENDAVEFTRLFLSTPFDGGRHLKRVNEIAAIERGDLEASINAMEGKKMENQVVVMQHPLIQHKLAYLRDTNTGSKEFRQLVSEIATLLCYEATRDLPLEEKLVETPCGTAKAKVISGRKLAFVPILRAGLGMVDGVLSLVPAAKVGHIGLYRDPKTLKPVEYYSKLPHDIEQRDVIVLDPMLATGGSSSDAVTIIKRSHPKSIKFMCIIAAPEGIKAFTETHPDVQLYCAAVDDHLNEHGYIVPGLGDAGDRIFGTL